MSESKTLHILKRLVHELDSTGQALGYGLVCGYFYMVVMHYAH